MMRMRWHHEYMRVSPTRTDHLIGKQGMCARLVGSPCLPCRVVSSRVESWIVLPLHKAIWLFVYTPLYRHCTARSNRWRLAERHKDAKTHSLSSSQPAPRSKRFSQACPQTCAISHISGTRSPLSFTHTFLFLGALNRTLSKFDPVAPALLFCVSLSANGPPATGRPKCARGKSQT